MPVRMLTRIFLHSALGIGVDIGALFINSPADDDHTPE